MIDEQNVREMLRRRANAVASPVVDAPKATRRARRRLLVNGVVAMLAVVTIASVGIAGVDELRSSPVPAAPTPSVTPSITPQPTRFTETFDSPLNGLSIGYPPGWRTRAATEPWAHDVVAFDAPDVNVIFDPTLRDDLYLAVASEPLRGTPARTWVSDELRSFGVCQGGGGGGVGNGFQGNPAWFAYAHEPHDALCHFVRFATSTRGYIIYFHAAAHLQATHSEHWFWGRDGVLNTVTLPDQASDAQSPLASP
jgi:hypothetical protein